MCVLVLYNALSVPVQLIVQLVALQLCYLKRSPESATAMNKVAVIPVGLSGLLFYLLGWSGAEQGFPPAYL